MAFVVVVSVVVGMTFLIGFWWVQCVDRRLCEANGACVTLGFYYIPDNMTMMMVLRVGGRSLPLGHEPLPEISS